MSLSLSPPMYLQFFDPNNSGSPLAGGKLFTYSAGTTTKADTWVDITRTVKNANPIILDANGGCYVWIDPTLHYKFVLSPSNDTDPPSSPYRTVDEISSSVTIDTITQAFLGAILYPQTSAESAASVTPTNYYYVPGDRRRYASLSDAVAVAATHPLLIYSSETITAHITVPDGFKSFGFGLPTITNSTAGDHVFDAVSKSNIVVDGVNFAGANSSTVPLNTFTGGAATDTGLLTFNLCTDVRITNCGFSTFYNGVCTIRTQRLWFMKNRITHWKKFGVQAAEALDYQIEDNDIVGTDASGTDEAYGVHATGDSTNSHPSTSNSVSFNRIRDIACWDGIMTHEAFGLRIIGNDIRNVRNGIDVGASGSTPDMKDIIIANNYIKSMTSDTYSGVAAHHTGIICTGKNSTYQINNVTIANNIVDGFFNATGVVSSGDTADIVVSYTNNATVTGNVICNTGSALGHPGILLAGDTIKSLSVTGNILQGTMSSGAIRASALIAASVAISGNSIDQTTTSHVGINISGSTISNLGIAGNAINSDAGAKLVVATSTITYTSCDIYNSGSATYDPPNLVDGAGTTTTVGCSGAALGDFTEASFSLDLQGITLTSWVSSSSTISVRFQNESGGALDLASGTLKVRSYPQ